MDRQSLLRRALLGVELPHPVTLEEQRSLAWATVHKPLAYPSLYTSQGRYLNHFCVGSDPEFSFSTPSGERVEAASCGLKAGLAAGCDQNRRLTELRPWPSVSVVEHVAGILTALRWMYRVYSRTIQPYQWRAGAFFSGDGMGGHIHFGRKRPTRANEVAGLDGLARVMKVSGLFPVVEWDRRMEGDRLGQHYGLPGDFRLQRHGYEYRSLPSWLQSPAVAFVVIALSKLAVLDPSICASWKLPDSQEVARNLLRGLAKLYKGRDDDAYLAYHIMTKSGNAFFQVDHAADFSPAWGITRTEVVLREDADIILPACVEPRAEEVQEIRGHLLFGTPLTFTAYPKSFRGTIPIEMGYQWLPRYVEPGTRSGFGDLLHNLVGFENFRLSWEYSNHNDFVIRGGLPIFWSTSDIALLKKYYPKVRIDTRVDQATLITVPKELCQTATIAGFRALLLYSGLFPVWTVESVEKDSAAKWLETHNKKKSLITWRQL